MYICQEVGTALKLTDRFLIFIKLKENRRCLSNIPYKAMQKDSSRHRLSRRVGSSFFLIFIVLGGGETGFGGAVLVVNRLT